MKDDTSMPEFATSSDSELIAFLNNGSEPAFNEIYNRYWSGIFLVARNRLSDDMEAEDVVQTIFSNIWRKRGGLQVKTNLKTYLSIAVKYEIINRYVKQQRETSFKAAFAQQQPQFDLSTQERITLNELEKILSESILLLPERCQLVFKLKFEEDYSQKQIAEELEISEKTVEAHLAKARRHIRASFGITASAYLTHIIVQMIN